MLRHISVEDFIAAIAFAAIPGGGGVIGPKLYKLLVKTGAREMAGALKSKIVNVYKVTGVAEHAPSFDDLVGVVAVLDNDKVLQQVEKLKKGKNAPKFPGDGPGSMVAEQSQLSRRQLRSLILQELNYN